MNDRETDGNSGEQQIQTLLRQSIIDLISSPRISDEFRQDLIGNDTSLLHFVPKEMQARYVKSQIARIQNLKGE